MELKLIIVLFIVLLFFGSSQLPKLSRSIGESARELKGAFDGKESEKTEDKSSKNKKG